MWPGMGFKDSSTLHLLAPHCSGITPHSPQCRHAFSTWWRLWLPSGAQIHILWLPPPFQAPTHWPGLGQAHPWIKQLRLSVRPKFRRESHHRRRAVVWADQRAGVPTPGFSLFVLKQGLAKCSPMQIWLTACLCE